MQQEDMQNTTVYAQLGLSRADLASSQISGGSTTELQVPIPTNFPVGWSLVYASCSASFRRSRCDTSTVRVLVKSEMRCLSSSEPVPELPHLNVWVWGSHFGLISTLLPFLANYAPFNFDFFLKFYAGKEECKYFRDLCEAALPFQSSATEVFKTTHHEPTIYEALFEQFVAHAKSDPDMESTDVFLLTESDRMVPAYTQFHKPIIVVTTTLFPGWQVDSIHTGHAFEVSAANVTQLRRNIWLHGETTITEDLLRRSTAFTEMHRSVLRLHPGRLADWRKILQRTCSSSTITCLALTSTHQAEYRHYVGITIPVIGNPPQLRKHTLARSGDVPVASRVAKVLLCSYVDSVAPDFKALSNEHARKRRLDLSFVSQAEVFPAGVQNSEYQDRLSAEGFHAAIFLLVPYSPTSAALSD